MSLPRPMGPPLNAHGGGFAYAQARIQARFADLPTEADWQHLGGLRGLSAWLEEARNGKLKPWVKGFSAQSGSHDIERGVRALYLESVDDTARVVPGPWRGAVHWCRWLALLPLFEHLANGRPVPAWVSADFRLTALFDAAALPGGPALDPDRVRALDLDALLAPIRRPAARVDEGGRTRAALPLSGVIVRPRLHLHAGAGDGPVAERWRAQWLAHWPSGGGHDRRRLAGLVGRVDAHRAAFAVAGPAQSWPLRRRLRERLRLEFHRHLMQPATAFLYIALVALDLERLRRALLDRALFGADQFTALAADPDTVPVPAGAGPVGAGMA